MLYVRRWSLKWITDHINVCKDPKYGLNNIPLVLQEFNLSPDDDRRKDFFQAVSGADYQYVLKYAAFDVYRMALLRGIQVVCRVGLLDSLQPASRCFVYSPPGATSTWHGQSILACAQSAACAAPVMLVQRLLCYNIF